MINHQVISCFDEFQKKTVPIIIVLKFYMEIMLTSFSRGGGGGAGGNQWKQFIFCSGSDNALVTTPPTIILTHLTKRLD